MIFKPQVNRTDGHIIHFLTDVDFYKITMLQFLLHHFPWAFGRYEFKCRAKDMQLANLKARVNEELDHLCTLRFQPFELQALAKCPFLTIDFIHFLRLFQLNREWITVEGLPNGDLKISAEGPIIHIMLFEIYVLEIVEELYVFRECPNIEWREADERLSEKISLCKEARARGIPFTFADFSSRRRASGEFQEKAIWRCRNEIPDVFVGTSNVLFSILYDVKWIGTMAHEIFQMGQALGPRIADSQKFILQKWAEEYRGNLGIALTDTLGFDKFLHDFDAYFAKLFDGGRHDSADPVQWGVRFINHYKSLKIDPLTKNAVWSDGLKFPSAIDLCDRFHKEIRTGFGIGTNFGNDTGQVTPVQIVMKIVECMGQPVAKKSDSPGKGMCEEPDYEAYLDQAVRRSMEVPNGARWV